MKKLILSAFFTLVAYYSFGQKLDTKNFNINEDKFENKTWVHNKLYLGMHEVLIIGAYFEVKDNRAKNLRIIIQNAGDNWLFVNKVQFLVGEQVYTFEDLTFDRTVASSRMVVEKADLPLSIEVKKVLNGLIETKNVKIRFTGEKGVRDRPIQSVDVKRLQKILSYYKELGGEV